MIALVIVLFVLALILLVLLAPFTAEIIYDDEFAFKFKCFMIKIYDSKSSKKVKKANETSKKEDQNTTKDDGFLKTTYKQKGFTGTVVYLSEIVKLVLLKIKWLLPHIKFHKCVLNLTVATSNAAETAINYGRVCSAVYPVFAFIQSNTKLKTKQFNISADFDKTKPDFNASIQLKARGLWLVIAALSIFGQFLKLQRKEREKYERKQFENSNGHNNGQASHNGGC